MWTLKPNWIELNVAVIIYIYIYMHIHTYIHTYIHTDIQTYTHILEMHTHFDIWFIVFCHGLPWLCQVHLLSAGKLSKRTWHIMHTHQTWHIMHTHQTWHPLRVQSQRAERLRASNRPLDWPWLCRRAYRPTQPIDWWIQPTAHRPTQPIDWLIQPV